MIVADLFIILAFLGLIIVTIALVSAALALKNGAMRNAKRIYEKPAGKVKSIIETGQGIVDRSTPRVRRAAKSVNSCVAQVKVVVDEGKTVVETIRESDMQPLLKAISAGAKFAEAAAAVARAMASQE